ncbi:hypothetical protein MKX01_001138 [Papaver californicum]|nr:hypothetical protein MKX01_001138 [Papaver californicum]
MARCSIELEPRTLNELELNVVREAAMDIILNSESGSNELASNLLIEGLRPMFPVKETTMDDDIEEEEEEEEQNSITNWYKENSIGTSKTNSSGRSKVVALVNVKSDDLQMSCDPNCVCNLKPIRIDKSPKRKYIREPVSAPL